MPRRAPPTSTRVAAAQEPRECQRQDDGDRPGDHARRARHLRVLDAERSPSPRRSTSRARCPAGISATAPSQASARRQRTVDSAGFAMRYAQASRNMPIGAGVMPRQAACGGCAAIHSPQSQAGASTASQTHLRPLAQQIHADRRTDRPEHQAPRPMLRHVEDLARQVNAGAEAPRCRPHAASRTSAGLEREATAPPACRTAISASTSEKRPPGDSRSQCAATKSSTPAARSSAPSAKHDQRQPALPLTPPCAASKARMRSAVAASTRPALEPALQRRLPAVAHAACLFSTAS